jgi:hypothetical protein
MVLPKAQIEDNAAATVVRAQMHLQELQVVDVDRICKQVGCLRNGTGSLPLQGIVMPAVVHSFASANLCLRPRPCTNLSSIGGPCQKATRGLMRQCCTPSRSVTGLHAFLCALCYTVCFCFVACC